MKLAETPWPVVGELSRDVVVLIPTGSLEQHGPHLPTITDTMIVTRVAEAVEAAMGDHVLLTPTIWQGASAHHLAFPGTVSASVAGYVASIEAVVDSLAPHGFRKFYVLNGHGGNSEPNGVALRGLKLRHPNATLGHCGYFAFATDVIAECMEGKQKDMRHACEAETSLMLHLAPGLVCMADARADGLKPDPAIRGVIHHFDEMTERGVMGDPTRATAEKGRLIFDAAVAGVVAELSAIAAGYVLRGI